MQLSTDEARRNHNSFTLRLASLGSFIVAAVYFVQHVLVPGTPKHSWEHQAYFYLFLFLGIFSSNVLIFSFAAKKNDALKNVVLHIWAGVLVLFSVVLALLQLYRDADLTSITAIGIAVCVLLSARPWVYIVLMTASFGLFCAGYLVLAPRGFLFDTLLTAFFATGVGAAIGIYLEKYRIRNLTLSAQLSRANSELVEQSLRDPLTGAYNRRFLEGYLAHEVGYSQRYQMPLCMVMIDVDHFKNINDTYGHPVGDLVLKELVQFFQSNLRQSDMVARYGGEEFSLILPATGLENAVRVADKLRATLAAYPIQAFSGNVTVSMGVACLNPGEDSDGLIFRSDQALYRAKNNGRNRLETN